MNPEYFFQKPPEFVFKYFSPARAGILRDLRIRFANPATFNDPFETCPRFDVWAEEITDAALQKITALHPLFGISPAQSKKFIERYKKEGLKERVKFHSQNFQKECGEKFRILCFSESIHSPLMWGHYCDCHAGFALQFDTKHPFFQNRLAKVYYDTGRPKINDRFPGLRIPLTKNTEWSYEYEWRIVQEATSTTPHFENLPVECIKAIYFGIRTPLAMRWEIQTVLNLESHAHIKKFEMILDDSTYRLIPVPISSNATISNSWLGEGI